MKKIFKNFSSIIFWFLLFLLGSLIESNRAQAAATRFYLPSTGAAAVSPTFSASWEKNTGALRLQTVLTKIGSTQLIQSSAHTSSNGTDDVLLVQYVSDPIPAQTITGTVKGTIKTRSTNSAADLRSQMTIYVVSNDGTTVRGTLLAPDTGTLTSEWSTSGTLVSKLFPVALRANTVTDVVAEEDDRIVIELGYRRHATVATSYTGRIYLQDDGSDLSESDSATDTGDPWIEFSADLFDVGDPPVHTVEQGSWRWYSDAASDGSMTALASENVAPTLTGAQMQNGTIRLRAQIAETAGVAGSGGITVQYSGDGTNWNTLTGPSGGSSNQPNYWFRFSDGSATGGNTITSQLVTSTTESGKYFEDTAVSASVGASAIHELDLAIQVRWPTPLETVKFRILYGGVPLASGTEITLTTSSVAARPHTIDRAPVGGKTSSELGYSAWPRQFYDGTRWWFFTKDEAAANTLRYYYWDGPGNNWSSVSTLDMGASASDGRHSVAFAMVSGVPHFYVHWGSSNSTRRFRRGVVSGTTITWDATQTLAQAARSHHHISVDDGGYVWVGGVRDNAGTPENLWIRRATSPDSVSAWESEIVITDAAIVANKVTAIVGLASNKALIIWHSVDALKYAVVSSTGVLSSGTIADPARREDWGVTRSNGYVYVVHTDVNADAGNWKLKVFNESTDAWSSGPDPGVSGAGQDTPSTDDGIAVTHDGDAIYAVGTFEGDWASDRVLYSVKYNGPGDAGTWEAQTAISPSSRGNGDRISPPLSSGGGIIPFTFDFADDDLIGNANAVEYHYITPPVISIVLNTDGTIAYGTRPLSSTISTLDLSDTQVFENNGNVNEDFEIKTSAAIGGIPWSLGGSIGTDIFKHEFSLNAGTAWTPFSVVDSYQSLTTTVAPAATKNLDFRLSLPSQTTDFIEKTITVEVLASES